MIHFDSRLSGLNDASTNWFSSHCACAMRQVPSYLDFYSEHMKCKYAYRSRNVWRKRLPRGLLNLSGLYKRGKIWLLVLWGLLHFALVRIPSSLTIAWCAVTKVIIVHLKVTCVSRVFAKVLRLLHAVVNNLIKAPLLVWFTACLSEATETSSA